MRFSSSVQLFTGRKAGGGGGDTEITNSAPRWVSKTFHIVKIKFPSLYRVFALKDMEDQTCPSSFTKEKFRRSRLSNTIGRHIITNILGFLMRKTGMDSKEKIYLMPTTKSTLCLVKKETD